MRELGRFLVRARMYDNEIHVHLRDIIDATTFPLVVTVTNALCQYDEETKKYTNPFLALKLGHLLKKAARILTT
ncbi:hypothetical protein DPMN_135428 [Dreissena polymorpha]|uniref:Uncharacterized protein n=1 Tax=Dreissena polymorpha TaxID=45954 RepID=A0A9D4JCU2_DREPO|nr:hypothetical protein DPMN_135428 [Dreissena polymorpha]